MSSCAPTGVAIFFLRAICPSRASRAMEATVKATARRLGHAPRPNKLTAAKPTATRSNVTLLGVNSNGVPWNRVREKCMTGVPPKRSWKIGQTSCQLAFLQSLYNQVFTRSMPCDPKVLQQEKSGICRSLAARTHYGLAHV